MAKQQLDLSGNVDADPKGCLLVGLILIALSLFFLTHAVGRIADAMEAAKQPAQEAHIAQ